MSTDTQRQRKIPAQASAPAASASLSSLVEIRNVFSRAVNLERDRDALQLLQAYIPTSRAIAALEQLADGLDGDPSGRALALIGPFGAGKSAFALFAGALLGPARDPAPQAAMHTLRGIEPRLAERFGRHVGLSPGLLRVQVNGIPDSMVRQLLLALSRAAEDAGLAAALVNRIRAAARPGTRMDQVVDLVDRARHAWREAGGCGVLLEIDELGKFLEYEAHNPGQHEIHLLQLLAEKTAESGPAPLCLVVMLHQAFEHYSNRLGKTLRDEWKKVQGRFSAIAFLEPAEQSLRVVAAAFHRKADLPPALAEEIFELAGRLTECSALPQALDLPRTNQLFQDCYPLHPVTLLILPMLCQRVAQNERTLFSYLASTEPFGLRRRLPELHLGEWIGPWELYDYFILNQAGGFSDPLTYHRWVEVITALERFEGSGRAETDIASVRLLKTIGLLNLIGAQRGLKASRAMLDLLFGAPLDEILADLEISSIIHFRGFAQEYRVWQGSDFDLHGALAQATAEQAARPLADTLNTLSPLPPVVARRATIETGTLRSFALAFTSSERWPPTTGQSELSLWLYLSEPGETPDLSGADPLAVVAVCSFTERLRELVSEWQALQELPRLHAQLQQDPVAQREHQAWLLHAETEAISTIRALLEVPETLAWHFGGEPVRIRNRRHLQAELSDWVLERCFPKTPYILNELINRERPSPAASTARKKLLAAMLKTPEHYGLGIEKAPAEKSLYLSLLHQSRLHRPGSDRRWDFFPPVPGDDPCNLRPAWLALTHHLGSAGERQVPLPELFELLRSPPFGIRLGVLPILAITYLLAHRREVALYQEGAFSETLTVEQAELLCRRPALFALERFALSGLRGELFQRYLGSIVGNLREDATLLDIVRPLVRFAQQLPEYAQHCAGLGAEAERVRVAFRQAKSPGRLLFEDLPAACGYDPAQLAAAGTGQNESVAGAVTEIVEPFIGRLIAVLRELNGAYPALLQRWRERLGATLLQQSEDADLSELRRALAERYSGLDRYAPQQGGVGAFVRRLAETHFDSDQAWLESVMTLLAKAPPAKWREAQRVNAELRLAEMAGQLHDLELLCANLPAPDRRDPTAGDTVMLKLLRPGREERRHIVHLSAEQQRVAHQTADGIAAQLARLDPNARVAVLAQLLDWLAPAADGNDGVPGNLAP